VLRALRGPHRRNDVRPVSYGSAQGYAPLRAQLQVRLAEIGIGATPEQIVLTYGVHQALDIVCRYFLKPGDCVLVDDPGYWNLFGNLRLYGVALLGVPRTPDGPDVKALEAILAHHQPRCSSPTRCCTTPPPATSRRPTPSGAATGREARLHGGRGRHLRRHRPRRRHPPGQPRPALRVIYTSSFSKTISGNLRVGFLACRPDLAHLFTDVKIVSMMSSAELSEQLIHQLLTDGHYRKLLDRLKGRLAEATGQALRMLERVGLQPDPEPRGGPFVWARVPGLADTAELARRAARDNILLAPGNVFRPRTSPPASSASTSASAPTRGSSASSATPEN
jgi:DNA-binding transcriptional MocR family regulator